MTSTCVLHESPPLRVQKELRFCKHQDLRGEVSVVASMHVSANLDPIGRGLAVRMMEPYQSRWIVRN